VTINNEPTHYACFTSVRYKPVNVFISIVLDRFLTYMLHSFTDRYLFKF